VRTVITFPVFSAWQAMKLPFTQKILMDWAGPRVFREAQSLHNQGYVQNATFEPPLVSGIIARGTRPLKCGLKMLRDGSAENLCPCYDSSERGIICSHVIALCLDLIRQKNDPERQTKLAEEQRRAQRLAAIHEEDYIQRLPADSPGAIPAQLFLELGTDWRDGVRIDNIPLTLLIEYEHQRVPPEQVPTDLPLTFPARDESILFVLEDIVGGPLTNTVTLPVNDFMNILKLLEGHVIHEQGTAIPTTVNAIKMTSRLTMDLDQESGELVLMVHTELPHVHPGDELSYIVSRRGGWVFGADNFWPLTKVLPEPLHAIYEEPIVVARTSVPRFLQVELPVLSALMEIEYLVSPDLFTLEPAEPRFRLAIRGSPASLAGTLFAEYGDIALVAGRNSPEGQFAHPDPDDLLRYTVRNMNAEMRALARLGETGMAGEFGDALSDIVGNRHVLNFLGGAMPALRRQGWRVEMAGRISSFMDEADFAAPVVQVGEAGANWFEVGFHFEDSEGKSLSEADIRRALRRGDAYLEHNGRTILLDADAIESMSDVFQDCASEASTVAGHFRLSNVHSAYVRASLDALDGVDVDAAPTWRSRAEKQNRMHPLEPVPIPSPLDKVLRSYQKEGVHWLRFIETNGFGGILADEMGLGKTLQTLTWLKLKRALPDAEGKPALIVCPTSLVGNWAEEARRFVPEMSVLEISGADRHALWANVHQADLVVTSYALLRRDVDQYLQHTFAAVVLDEAQHIKNRSTQNAVAAKKIQALHRLVLTGTPIENSVSDLWSIMDFLMPGYLGHHESFRRHYETPIAAGGTFAEVAQKKLRRKLHPFLLRRLKREVAKDLPPRIDRVAYCTLSTDQKMVYKELLAQSRREITDLVNKQGFNRSRMQILKTLMRLRQVCCHLDLLKLDGLNSQHPSEKLNLFFELVNEAIDADHRILVFSQFTSMLAILRKQLDAQKIAYCYLDGSTRDRMQVVHTFNTERAIPIFLISLKAGGTGLNLTGADMVIHYDPWWNPAVEDQATDRAHRIGQNRTVYNVKLITRDSVEEKVLAMQQKKKAVISATLSSDEQVLSKLSWEDVQELLGGT
jgi:superfamily II DNA or RNA helicase